MRIGIIGTGNIGGALAAAAVQAGHQVTVAAAHRDHADKVANDTGATAVDTAADTARGADVVVLAVPATAAGEVLADLGAAALGPVILDVTNPVNATFSDLTTVGTSNTELLSAQAPAARIVKAINTVLASRIGAPQQDGAPLDAFYAGDDEGAKATVAELLGSLGFRPVDAGPARMARSLEELALLNITLNARNGWTWQSAYRLVGPTG
jgi:predicted dinucleotide-binding enzyme